MLLGLAGLAKPPVMDGHSIAPLLLHADGALPATRRHLAAVAPGGAAAYAAAWREEVFLEYYFCEHNDKCVQHCDPSKSRYPAADADCGDLEGAKECWSPICDQDCYRTEDDQNNWIALRRPGKGGDADPSTLYAEFQAGDLSSAPVEFDAVNFVEVYDVAADPWQMRNLANATPAAARQALHDKLHRWYKCAGDTCP